MVPESPFSFLQSQGWFGQCTENLCTSRSCQSHIYHYLNLWRALCALIMLFHLYAPKLKYINTDLMVNMSGVMVDFSSCSM